MGSKILKVHFNSIYILDWYDGVILGVARDNSAYFLILLIACKVDSDQRIFGVLTIEEQFAEDLIQFTDDTTLSENLLTFRKILNSGILTSHNQAYLAEGHIDINTIINLYPDPSFKIAEFVPYDTYLPFDDQKYAQWSSHLKILKGK